MEVNGELVDKLAALAKLEFNQTEKTRMISEFQKMLNFVEKLNEVDTEGVAPLIHMSNSVNVFRDDESKPSLKQEEVLKNAPDNNSDYFKVPKVLNK